MVQIYLIRHAQSTGNIEKRLTGRVDYELTEEGKKQSEKLANYLQNIHFDVSYSSPSIRAIHTIKKLAKMNEIEIQILPKLSEMYFGIYDGYKWEEVDKINPSISILHNRTNEIMEIPQQETTKQVGHRMYETIKIIAKKNSNKNILIASHGVAIEAFLRKVSKEPFINKIDEYSQKNASINILQFEESTQKFNIKLLNYYKYL